MGDRFQYHRAKESYIYLLDLSAENGNFLRPWTRFWPGLGCTWSDFLDQHSTSRVYWSIAPPIDWLMVNKNRY